MRNYYLDNKNYFSGKKLPGGLELFVVAANIRHIIVLSNHLNKILLCQS